MSEDNNDIIDDIDETLDLSDLDEVDSVIDDLDKSLSDIDISVNADSNQDDNKEESDHIGIEDVNDHGPTIDESDHSMSEDETGEIQVSGLSDADLEKDESNLDQPNNESAQGLSDVDSTTEVLLDDVNAAMEGIENLKEVEDFDPLGAKEAVFHEDSIELPDFKSAEDITTIITTFETYSLAALEESLKKLSPDMFMIMGIRKDKKKLHLSLRKKSSK